MDPVDDIAADLALLAPDGAVSIYASDSRDLEMAVRPAMVLNARLQFVLVYTLSDTAKRAAVADVQAAVYAGALRAGAEAGLPLQRFTLEQTAAAHDAVEHGATGKVLIEIATTPHVFHSH